MSSPNPVTDSSPAGSIYDLGYRHYEGPRRGRIWAMWSLFVESLRGVWGFGRPMSAKAAPFILGGLYALPALFQLAFASVLAKEISSGSGTELMTYRVYFGMFYFLVIFFCVAQAPELVCRDQRYRVLPLYFTRSLSRAEYALARLASLAAALFLLLMVPCVALFVGDILMQPDTFKAIGDELPKALPALPANALIAAALSALSLTVSSFSPRRAYAAIALVAYVLLAEAVPGAISAIGRNSDWTWTDKLFALTPITSLIGASDWFFGQTLNPQEFTGSLTADAYVVVALMSVVVFTMVLLFRYRRLPA